MQRVATHDRRNDRFKDDRERQLLDQRVRARFGLAADKRHVERAESVFQLVVEDVARLKMAHLPVKVRADHQDGVHGAIVDFGLCGPA